MITFLFKLAAVVTLVFALIASLTSGGTCLGENIYVWLSCGLLAGFFALFFAPWFDVELNSARNRPARPAPPAA